MDDRPRLTPADQARHIEGLMTRGDDAQALAALGAWTPGPDQQAEAAGLALQLGRPRLAAQWAQAAGVPLLEAAARLRLGQAHEALALLAAQPETARTLLLTARAHALLGSPGARTRAEAARAAARREGDAPALEQAATLLGELLRPHDHRAALRALAEGLKAAEVAERPPDPHLLAALATVQADFGAAGPAGGGNAKAQATAEKALARSRPRSPARVLALRALGRHAEAEREALAGELFSLISRP